MAENSNKEEKAVAKAAKAKPNVVQLRAIGNHKLRKNGTLFELSPERAEVLIRKGYAERVAK